MFQLGATPKVNDRKPSCHPQIIDNAEREPIGLTSGTKGRTGVNMHKKRRNRRRPTGTITKMKLVKRHGSTEYSCDDITQGNIATEQSNGKDAPKDGDANSEHSDNSRTLANETNDSAGCCTDDDKHSEKVADATNGSGERTRIDCKVCKENDASKLNDGSKLKWDSKTKEYASEITFSKVNGDSKEIDDSKEKDGTPHCRVNGDSCSAGAAGETACFEGKERRCETERCQLENGSATDNVEPYNATTDDCDSDATGECVDSRSTPDKCGMGDGTRRNGMKPNRGLIVTSVVGVGVELPVSIASTESTEPLMRQKETTRTTQHHVHDQTLSNSAQTLESRISQAGDNTGTSHYARDQTPRTLHADITPTPLSPTTPSLLGITPNHAHASEDTPQREEHVPSVITDTLSGDTTGGDLWRPRIDCPKGASIGDKVTEDTDVLTDPRNAAAVMDINDNTKCASDVRQSDVHHNGIHVAKHVQHERSLETASNNEHIESFG